MDRASIDPVRGKLGRAECHFADLKKAIHRDVDGCNPRFTCDPDTETPAYIFRVWDLPTFSDDLPYILGDCIHNARSALDHLAYQLAILCLGSPLPPEYETRVNFPISSDPTDWKDRQRSKIAPLSLGIRTRIEALQPHNAWDWSIWKWPRPGWPQPAQLPSFLQLLANYDNTDKHRAIHPVWIATDYPGNLPSLDAAPEFKKLITDSPFGGGALENGAEIARWTFADFPIPPIPSEVDVESGFPLEIRMGDVLPLANLYLIVEGMISAAHFRSFGFRPACVSFENGVNDRSSASRATTSAVSTITGSAVRAFNRLNCASLSATTKEGS